MIFCYSDTPGIYNNSFEEATSIYFSDLGGVTFLMFCFIACDQGTTYLQRTNTNLNKKCPKVFSVSLLILSLKGSSNYLYEVIERLFTYYLVSTACYLPLFQSK